MAKIQITEGTWNDECTTELNLTNAHQQQPEKGFDTVITYGEQRHLMTFLTAGATNGKFTVSRTTEAYKTRVPKVPTGELIDGKAWKYNIMGRIQRAAEIVGTGAVGTPTAGTTQTGGFFNIKFADNYIQPDMVVSFYNGKMARVQSITKAPGYYLYSFQCFPGDTFSWATWVAPQAGRKTAFGGFSMHGERSLRGFGRTHYPDSYINHMTIQRKGYAITGDANAEKVLWYMVEGKDNSKGWIYWIEAQQRAQFLMEDEFQKWWGPSTMKDADGNLLSTPSMSDPETGMPMIAGDGFIPQIKGANDVEASGIGGLAVWDDFSDLVREAKKHVIHGGGKRILYFVTGSDGIENIHNQALTHAKTNYNFTQNVGVDVKDLIIGYNFVGFNIQGTICMFVENPMMDDEEKFPRKLSNGRLAMSNTYYLMDGSTNGSRPNIEIRTRGRKGVNRNMVYFYENGMTGDGEAKASIDGKEFQMLKENMFVIYNTKSSGIISPSETA